MTTLGTDIVIYSSAGVEKISAPYTKDAIQRSEIMKEHFIKLSFHSKTLVAIELGDYVTYDGIVYTIQTIQKPTDGDGKYIYELQFDAPEMMFRNFILFYLARGNQEPTWSLTGTPESFLDVIIACINYHTGETWTKGTVTPTASITNTFDGVNIFEGLTRLAELSESEWWTSGKTINLCKYEIGDAIDLKKDEIINNITPSKSNEAYCNRIYAFGSTRNIPATYREEFETENDYTLVTSEKKLQLPTGIPYVEESMTASDIPALLAGTYTFAELLPSQIVSKIKEFDIYPKKILTIKSVILDTEYFISQNDIVFDEDYEIADKDLEITFETGKLAGRTFTVDYTEYLNFIYEAKLILDDAKAIILICGNIETALANTQIDTSPSGWQWFAGIWRTEIGDHIDDTTENLIAAISAYDYALECFNLAVADSWGEQTTLDFENARAAWITAAELWNCYASFLYDWREQALAWMAKIGTYTDATTPFTQAISAYNLVIAACEDAFDDYMGSIPAAWNETLVAAWVSLIPDWETKALNWYVASSGSWFKIITSDDGLDLPNAILTPEIGDTFILYNFDISLVSDQYVTDAEEELLTAAIAEVEYLKKDTNTYDTTTNPVYCGVNAIDLALGQKVNLYSSIFDGGYRESRIWGYEKRLDNTYKAKLTIGDASRYSRSKTLEKAVENLKAPIYAAISSVSRRVQANTSVNSALMGGLSNVEATADLDEVAPKVLVKEGATWKVKLHDHIRKAICDSNGIPTETATGYLLRVDSKFRYVGLSAVLKRVLEGVTQYIRYEFVDGILDSNFIAMEYANDFNGGLTRGASAEIVKTLHGLVMNIDPGTF
jgi:hypothetical protein